MMATTYLAEYTEGTEEKAEDKVESMFYSHPLISFIVMNILAGAGILGAVCAITFLGALPIYFFLG